MIQRMGALAVLACLAALAACKDAPAPDQGQSSNTAVLGGFGSRAASTDAGAQLAPPEGAPRGTPVVQSGPDQHLALWLRDGHVMAAIHTAAGWSAPQPLEEIHGEASDPQLASNGRGSAMALWRHTVGNIQSLRYSRFDSSGWSVPDVMPGALPRPRGTAAVAPKLRMEADGSAHATWASGFGDNEVQTARYMAGQGWSRALSEPVTAAR